jgi:hypothetical protein
MSGRVYALVRGDITDTSGVPPSLSGFAKARGTPPMDLTLAGTWDLAIRVARSFAVVGTVLVGVPRATALFFKIWDSQQPQTVYYDPTFFEAGFGLGASYSW